MFNVLKRSENAMDPYFVLGIINELAIKLQKDPSVPMYATAAGVRAVCYHFGWSPEELIRVDADKRAMTPSVSLPK
jgi:hypothetical protein